MAKKKTPDDKLIEYIETRYMFETRRTLYTANEETNQIWEGSDVPDVIAAWNNNWTISEIAEYLGADRHEMELLMVDLIHQGKIRGNIHVFKPRRKVGAAMFKVGEVEIRSVIHEKQIWICLKDIWKSVGKPDHSYRKTTENWPPQHRAKFQLDTPGGPQYFHFLNAEGLKRLEGHLNNRQREALEDLKGEIANGLGFQSGNESGSVKKQPRKEKQKRTGRIRRQNAEGNKDAL